jgi:Flp pilus assembly protein TadB
MAESIPEATPLSEAAGPRAGAWAVGVFAFVALIGASIVSVGLASIVWVPLLLGIGIVMVTIGSARRRRQSSEGRNGDEVKDPTHAHPHWPTKGVIDDRLPEP